ncbi:MAG TPA: flagellar assembly protein FliX [Patescibacteria group bacterium]|jgi:hypothetical protein|nr:flagellar assembly protein FliX [Patescibacteria group bacterium]
MKVEGPNRTSQADQTRKKDKVSSGGGSFGKMVTGETSETQGSAASQSIASIDSLLAIQGADDPAQRAASKRMRHRADTLLKELDRIRMGLLSGNLTVGHVIDIADVVASHREKIMDPQLTAILDEIDLRAQIELAKMRLSLDKAV